MKIEVRAGNLTVVTCAPKSRSVVDSTGLRFHRFLRVPSLIDSCPLRESLSILVLALRSGSKIMPGCVIPVLQIILYSAVVAYIREFTAFLRVQASHRTGP
jgi:hypothetical protein